MFYNDTEVSSILPFRSKVAFINSNFESFQESKLTIFEAILEMARLSGVHDAVVQTENMLSWLEIDLIEQERLDSQFLTNYDKIRVKMAFSLVSGPSLIFLHFLMDDIDSFQKLKLSDLAKNLALEGRTVIASIKNPPNEVLEKFQKIMCLSHGEIVYSGEQENLYKHFARLGYINHLEDDFYNPANYLTKVLGEDQDLIETHFQKLNPAHIKEKTKEKLKKFKAAYNQIKLAGLHLPLDLRILEELRKTLDLGKVHTEREAELLISDLFGVNQLGFGYRNRIVKRLLSDLIEGVKVPGNRLDKIITDMLEIFQEKQLNKNEKKEQRKSVLGSMTIFNDEENDTKGTKQIKSGGLCFVYALKYGFLRDFRNYFREKNNYLFDIIWGLIISFYILFAFMLIKRPEDDPIVSIFERSSFYYWTTAIIFSCNFFHSFQNSKKTRKMFSQNNLVSFYPYKFSYWMQGITRMVCIMPFYLIIAAFSLTILRLNFSEEMENIPKLFLVFVLSHFCGTSTGLLASNTLSKHRLSDKRSLIHFSFLAVFLSICSIYGPIHDSSAPYVKLFAYLSPIEMGFRASMFLEFENQEDPYTSSCPSTILKNSNKEACSPYTLFPFLKTDSFASLIAILIIHIFIARFIFLLILAKRYCFSEYKNSHIPDPSTFTEKLDTNQFLLAEKSSKSKEKFVRRGMEFLSKIRMSRIISLNQRKSTKRKTLGVIVPVPQRSQIKRATFGAARMNELKQRRKNRIKTNMENRLKMSQQLTMNDMDSSSDLSIDRRHVQSTIIQYGTPLNVISEEKTLGKKRSTTANKRVSRVNVMRRLKSRRSISNGSNKVGKKGGLQKKFNDPGLRKRESKAFQQESPSLSKSSNSMSS